MDAGIVKGDPGSNPERVGNFPLCTYFGCQGSLKLCEDDSSDADVIRKGHNK